MIGRNIAGDEEPLRMPHTIRPSSFASSLMDKSLKSIHALVPVFLVTSIGASTSNWRRLGVLRSQSFGATAVLAFIAGTVGCSTAGPPRTVSSSSPELKAHCRELYGLWMRYNSRDHNHSGEQAQAELALSDCQRGYFDTGLAELEHLLREDEIPFPQRRDESASRRPSPSARTTWTVEAAKPMCSSGIGVGDPS